MVVHAVEEFIEPVVEAEGEKVIGPVVDVVEGHMDALMMDMEEDLVVLFGDDDFEDDVSGGFSKEERNDAEIAAGVTIGEIGSSILVVEGQMQVMASQMIQVVDRVEQALQADVQQRDTQIQQLQTTVTEMSSRENTLMRCILGLEKRIAALERRPPGPQWVDSEMVSPRLKVRNGEDFSYRRRMLPLTYQLMSVKKTSFLEIECGGSIDISIPDAVKDQGGALNDA
ncbi:hypothetical protein Tco_0834866 [Tanacetum coccineum]